MRICDRCGKPIDIEDWDLIEEVVFHILGIRKRYDLCNECKREIERQLHEVIEKVRDMILKSDP